MNSVPQALARKLRELEQSLLLPDVRKSRRLVELLADAFVEYGSSGRACTKADLVAALQAESPVAQTASDFRVALMAPTVALLTYRLRRDSDPPLHTLQSSLWRARDGQWRMVFQQATARVAP